MDMLATVEIRRCRFGKGVFVRRRFRRYEIIGQVQGSLLRERDGSGYHLIDVGSGLCLDPDPPFRFLNHSCRPNAELVMHSAGAGLPMEIVVVVALRNVRVGEQVLIDYAWDADVWHPCRCGEDGCRGWIVSNREAGSLRRNRPARGTARIAAT